MKYQARIVVIYVIVCSAYIFLSDVIVYELFPSASEITNMQTYKGIFFVFASGGLIYFLIRKSFQEVILANENLERTVHHHKLMFQKCPIPAFVVDKQTFRYLKVNEAATIKYTRSEDEYLKKTPLDYYPGLTKDDLKRLADQIGTESYVELLMEVPDKGKVVHENLFCQDFLYEGNPSLLFIALDLSITEESEIWVMDRMLDVIEEERKRISSELHDGITQYLAMSNSITGSIREALNNDDSTLNISDGLARVFDLTERGARESRNMSHSLIPSSLSSLPELLKNLVGNLNYVRHVKFEFEASINHTYNSIATLNLFRITQEALRNIVTHSGATHATVSLNEKNDHLTLTISDNGRGFDVSLSPKALNSIGLKTMRTRALKLGGTLQITSELHQGTKVLIRIPISKNEGISNQTPPLLVPHISPES